MAAGIVAVTVAKVLQQQSEPLQQDSPQWSVMLTVAQPQLLPSAGRMCSVQLPSPLSTHSPLRFTFFMSVTSIN